MLLQRSGACRSPTPLPRPLPKALASREKETGANRTITMSKLAKLLLATTAFAPVLLTYAAVSIINCEYWHAAAFLTICALLVLVCAGLLRFAKSNLQSRSYCTATVETADKEVFGLLLLYLLPLITRDLATYNWLAWILVTFLFCLVVATSYGYHFNPLLVFLRYHFYKVTETDGIPHVLITNRRIYKTGETLSVARLAEYVLIEKKPPG